MKTRAGYVIRQLADTFYIIPTGQRIADRRRCLKINQTGCVIWDLLQKDLSWEELLSAYTEYVKSIEMTENTKTVKPASIGEEASTVTVASISSDLSTYVLTLFQFGMIQASAKEMQAFPFAPFQAKGNAYYCRYNIAGIQVHYKGRKEWLHAFFEPFLEDGKENPSAHIHMGEQIQISQNWRVRPLSEVPEIAGELLLFGSQLDVYRCSGDYMLRFPSNHHLALCMLSFDGKEAVFYYDGSTQQEAVDELFYGFRAAFFYLAALHGKYALHSASNYYQEKAWLYSASSGTGKTTHVKLWEKLYAVPVLNGDLNLLGMENDEVFVYGIPWCGTSGVYTTKKYPLGGIILLKRGTENRVCKLPQDERQLYTAQRMISPAWTEKQVDDSLLFAEKLSDRIPIRRLYCTQEPSAAAVMKEYIDKYLTI
jgi:hypothetical protein